MNTDNKSVSASLDPTLSNNFIKHHNLSENSVLSPKDDPFFRIDLFEQIEVKQVGQGDKIIPSLGLDLEKTIVQNKHVEIGTKDQFIFTTSKRSRGFSPQVYSPQVTSTNQSEVEFKKNNATFNPQAKNKFSCETQGYSMITLEPDVVVVFPSNDSDAKHVNSKFMVGALLMLIEIEVRKLLTLHLVRGFSEKLDLSSFLEEFFGIVDEFWTSVKKKLQKTPFESNLYDSTIQQQQSLEERQAELQERMRREQLLKNQQTYTYTYWWRGRKIVLIIIGLSISVILITLYALYVRNKYLIAISSLAEVQSALSEVKNTLSETSIQKRICDLAFKRAFTMNQEDSQIKANLSDSLTKFDLKVKSLESKVKDFAEGVKTLPTFQKNHILDEADFKKIQNKVGLNDLE